MQEQHQRFPEVPDVKCHEQRSGDQNRGRLVPDENAQHIVDDAPEQQFLEKCPGEQERGDQFVSSMCREGVATVSRMPKASKPAVEHARISIMAPGASKDRKSRIEQTPLTINAKMTAKHTNEKAENTRIASWGRKAYFVRDAVPSVVSMGLIDLLSSKMEPANHQSVDISHCNRRGLIARNLFGRTMRQRQCGRWHSCPVAIGIRIGYTYLYRARRGGSGAL